MRRPKILVAGSFVLDQIAVTKTVPGEGETVLGTTFRKAPGGKGLNQAAQAAKLGAEVTMVGKLGQDGNGRELLSACQESGVNSAHVLLDEEQPSGCALIVLEEKEDGSVQNRILVVPGANHSIRPQEIEFLKEEIAEYDMVLLQLEISMEINEQIAAYAYEKGVPVMLNSAPSAPLSDTFLSHLTFISPNEHEVEDLTGIKIHRRGGEINQEDVKKAAGKLLDKGVTNVLITLGSGGAALCNRNGCYYAPCVRGIAAVDPTAAGDSFVGAFCTGFCCGLDWEELLTFANHVAAITVTGMGALPSLPELEQVEQLLKKEEIVFPELAVLKKQNLKPETAGIEEV
ncbi:ribokinase [Blautia hydrogenotrophica]|uniref:ribokinase n=2 Tax=Blautia hydrogenotrophica TaxID=53443 RepID=UPI0006BFE80A|nr:ribokinase [Blautia hydrogenotrophica]MEE0462838.1 ribokinase [Blautia hydrogenotrophica]CUM91280.1 Ribokinase [Blautia hydrogenotrophica]SCH52621.1 Ribokinase [uncultured Blautia sp.]